MTTTCVSAVASFVTNHMGAYRICFKLGNEYNGSMNKNNHTTRLAVLLALAVVALVTVSIDQFRGTGEENQAAVLRAYVK